MVELRLQAGPSATDVASPFAGRASRAHGRREPPSISLRLVLPGNAGLAQDAAVDLIVADHADQPAVLDQYERIAGPVPDLERGAQLDVGRRRDHRVTLDGASRGATAFGLRSSCSKQESNGSPT
jgi:hypothetical protein